MSRRLPLYLWIALALTVIVCERDLLWETTLNARAIGGGWWLPALLWLGALAGFGADRWLMWRGCVDTGKRFEAWLHPKPSTPTYEPLTRVVNGKREEAVRCSRTGEPLSWKVIGDVAAPPPLPSPREQARRRIRIKGRDDTGHPSEPRSSAHAQR